ncbi:uncharacterized protein LAESUDRAFT_505783 [Laetiporus sulphureus 93-53]|uniref:Uncharacterized protein n=1 Tax=Laetiporus sulphureus 93-53 TaxID=1314785 RepID=A0A165FV21_9APHY|nr:uncharacterized protein LAESUDRAFT_505783 [Laetiporus sulphureus 93-53]KZT09450.1 hypothetical protein LAESUDRAFT_505783 [Laetiporus sulphureus 93-53]
MTRCSRLAAPPNSFPPRHSATPRSDSSSSAHLPPRPPRRVPPLSFFKRRAIVFAAFGTIDHCMHASRSTCFSDRSSYRKRSPMLSIVCPAVSGWNNKPISALRMLKTGGLISTSTVLSMSTSNKLTTETAVTNIENLVEPIERLVIYQCTPHLCL